MIPPITLVQGRKVPQSLKVWILRVEMSWNSKRVRIKNLSVVARQDAAVGGGHLKYHAGVLSRRSGLGRGKNKPEGNGFSLEIL